MSVKSEAGSAGRRSPASDVVFAGADDDTLLTTAPTEIQTARLRKKFGLPMATANVVAELALGIPEKWRRG